MPVPVPVRVRVRVPVCVMCVFLYVFVCMHAGAHQWTRKLAQVTGQGGWTMLSSDIGVVAIHSTPIPNGEVFFYERNGNRETPV